MGRRKGTNGGFRTVIREHGTGAALSGRGGSSVEGITCPAEGVAVGNDHGCGPRVRTATEILQPTRPPYASPR